MNTFNISRFTPHLAVLALVMASVIAGIAVAAPQDPPSSHRSAGDADPHRSMMKIDANQDGMIDRAEAGKHPRLAGKFDTLDTNKDGKLDRSERPSWKGKRGHRGGMARVIKLDTDGDGRISRAEAAASPKISEHFEQADANRDGYLVRSELRAAGDKRRVESTAKRAQHFEQKFVEADGNRDDKLSRAEVEAKMPHLAKAFAFHDEDRDGFLTRADLQPTPRH